MREIDHLDELREHLAAGGTLADIVVQGLDLTGYGKDLDFTGGALLGCRLTPGALARAQSQGALLFPEIPDVPYAPYRPQLYTVEELYEVFDPADPASYEGCLDARVYRHWLTAGRDKPASLLESLAQRLHDHAVTDALDEFLEDDGTGTPRRVVAIMGGHAMHREPTGAYATVARLSRALARRGYLMTSGGGPGAMEATHLGPWFAARPDEDLEAALALLATAPSYKDTRWLAAAFEVRARYPLTDEAPVSLGIPTWLYGHEPPNAFATHVAKYFANSVREDGLLTIATAGVIFSPGGSGTIQEVFQDACQNRYVTAGVVSPMVFLDEHFWRVTKPVYPLLEQLAAPYEYAKWLRITDEIDEVVAVLEDYQASDSARAAGRG